MCILGSARVREGSTREKIEGARLEFAKTRLDSAHLQPYFQLISLKESRIFNRLFIPPPLLPINRRLDLRAAILFQKLRSSGIEIDCVLYQTMIVAYERAGLVGHAKRLLHELKRSDNVPQETAIKILAGAGRIEEATLVFRRAFQNGEVKDISTFGCMIDLYSNVIEVFDNMRQAGYFPDSNVIALVLNAYGKLREFDEADALYTEMQEEGCIFPDEVHFQMLTLYGAKRDFEMVQTLFERLESDPNMNKKELNLVVASIYERANRLNDASRVINGMSDKGLCFKLSRMCFN